jgi:hypothetical protein
MPNRTSKAFSAWQTCIERDKEFRQKIGIEQDMKESQRMCKKQYDMYRLALTKYGRLKRR